MAEPDNRLRAVDPEEPVARLLRDLRTSPGGLSSREAARRLVVYGRNELQRRGGQQVWRELARQFTHPLALLLWAAAGLAWLGRIVAVAIAIVIVIVLNAVFAFLQELQAERAVEALQGYLPQQATVLRDGTARAVPAAGLVPGDVMVIEEGERISADGRLLSGSVEIDASTLTGESMPVARSADWGDNRVPFLQTRDLVFSGTTCTGGEATAVVVTTGMRTLLGRIAALSQRVESEQSPLDRQVRAVAWLIAVIAVVMAVAFMRIAGGLAGSSVLRQRCAYRLPAVSSQPEMLARSQPSSGNATGPRARTRATISSSSSTSATSAVQRASAQAVLTHPHARYRAGVLLPAHPAQALSLPSVAAGSLRAERAIAARPRLRLPSRGPRSGP